MATTTKTTKEKAGEKKAVESKAAKAEPKASKAEATAVKKEPAAPKAPKKQGPMLKVKQIGSPIRRHFSQELHLKALGLGKMNRVRELQDTPSVRGLIEKVKHMVEIVS